MLRIGIDEVEAPGFLDLAGLAATPSLERAARLLLGAPKGTGPIGKGIQDGVEEALSGLAAHAAAAILKEMPAHVLQLITLADGTMNPDYGQWLMDGQGNFAAVFEGEAALLGTAQEFTGGFSAAALRIARRMACDPRASAEVRYRAAMLAMPRLAVVNPQPNSTPIGAT